MTRKRPRPSRLRMEFWLLVMDVALELRLAANRLGDYALKRASDAEDWGECPADSGEVSW